MFQTTSTQIFLAVYFILKSDMKHYSKVALVSHVYTTVPLDALIEYFISRTKQLFVISHPLFPNQDHFTKVEKYSNFKTTYQNQYRRLLLPVPLIYLYDTLFTLYIFIRNNQKFDIYIGLNNLNVIAGLILKKIGIVNKVVYYTIDFVPNRFTSKILNKIYHYVDAYAVKNADITWNVSPRIKTGREDYQGMIGEIYKNQMVVPIGVWVDRIKAKDFSSINVFGLIYAGGLSAHQGVQHVINALPIIVSKIPTVKLTIIGKGQYESQLQKLAKKNKVEKFINFLGYLETHEEVEKVVSENAIALAIYDEKLDLWSKFADPSKIKTYLACSCPVITTTLTHMADEILKNKAGMIVETNPNDIAKAVFELLLNQSKLKQYRDNARKLSESYDWEKILDSALDNS